MNKEQRERIKREQLYTDIEFMLRNSQSKRFLLWIVQSCGIYSTSYDGNQASSFQEGQRNVGLKIIAEISNVSPLAYPELLLENARNLIQEQMADMEPMHDAD